MVAAYVFFEAHQQDHLPAILAVLLGLLASAALGAAFHLLVLRRMRDASMLAKIVATLALLVVLQDLTVLKYGPVPQIVTSILPNGPITDLRRNDRSRPSVHLRDRRCPDSRRSGRSTSSHCSGWRRLQSAANPRAAAALAVSPNLIATANWAIGAALGGLAAILLVPITSLSSDILSLMVIPVLAAAVVGRFSSFPITMMAGLAIGVAQSEVTRWVNAPGWATAVPFLFVVVTLIGRGRSIAGKDESVGRLPSLGTGKIPPGLVVLGVGMAVLCISEFSSTWMAALQVQMVMAIVLISLVVVTGFAGQVSLAQMGFAGVGAVIASWLYFHYHWPFELAILGGVVGMIPFCLVVGLAGVRTRGVHLAIVTLGLAYFLDAVVFGNPSYTGGLGYPTDPRFFGIDVSTMTHPGRYAVITLALLVLIGLAVANLRRGRAGRRLIAVRTNERAAAALGVSVVGAKLYGFVLGGMIAAVGGILLAFDPIASGSNNFGGMQSITLMQNSVFGGAGHLGGPLIGSTFQSGTLGQQVFSFLGGNAAFYLSLVSGVGLLVMLPRAP